MRFIEGEHILFGQTTQDFNFHYVSVEVVVLAQDLGPVSAISDRQLFGSLKAFGGQCLNVRLEFFVRQLTQRVFKAAEECLDSGIQILWMSLRLDNYSEPLGSIRPPHPRKDNVTKLFLCSQLVVTALVDDLAEQFQQHVEFGVLKTCLVVAFNARALVNGVGGGVEAGRVFQLHFPFFDQL